MKITLDHVTKKYKGRTAVTQVCAELSGGQLVGLAGGNGAGKTTLLKMLATILKPSDGTILLDGVDIIRRPDAMREAVGYLPQSVVCYPNLTAYEYLNYIASLKGIDRKKALRQIEALLEEFRLAGAQHQRLSQYSGGMKQRVGIICALLGNPRIIIADEPSAGLDPQERAVMRNTLSRLSRDRIVILSTHIVSDIEAVASRIMILKKGNLSFYGRPEMLISNANGCVWEYTADTPPENRKGISNMLQTEHGIRIRQVSRSKPAAQAVPVQSSLEDACLLELGE